MWQVLGQLADDDEHQGRLRETVRVFLATGNSFATTAERLVLHRNTVQYRVRKAEEAVGHPIQDHRADIELALRVCQVLGATVLRPPSA
ncbi:MAG TPA: helix-turn-helix domain-containing protein [Kribbellaceae bacterium]